MSVGGETYRVTLLVKLLFLEDLMENTEKQTQKMCTDSWKGPSTASTVIQSRLKTQTPQAKESLDSTVYIEGLMQKLASDIREQLWIPTEIH